MIWQWLGNLLAGPIVGAALEGYKTHVQATTTQDAHARDVAVAAITAEIEARREARAILIAEQGRWWTALPRPFIAMCFGIYIFKVVVWDKVLGWGVTDPLGIEMSTILSVVITALYGGRTLEKITSTIASRFGKK
jgi:hypothetical protein